MFMEIAIGAIGIGIVLMIGYLVIAQVKAALPVVATPTVNGCYGTWNGATPCTDNYCGIAMNSTTYNTSAYVTCVDTRVTAGLTSTQTTVFAGFGLVAVGIIVLAAFGLINVFRG